MKIAVITLTLLLSACTTNNYTYTDSSRTNIRVTEAVIKKAPVKRQTPKVRDCENPYQAEKKLCEGTK